FNQVAEKLRHRSVLHTELLKIDVRVDFWKLEGSNADSGAKSPSVPAQRAQPLRLKKPTQSGATWPVCCEACGEG
ncbi:MAG: hypothetical protein KAI25_09265, partial [Hyphomicrobiaceae bacterium]|nr:hypothetical protein [Hyphomicrobiaceae bacterium]